MTIDNITNFLADNAIHLKKLAKRKDTSLGFNVFELVSNTYYRENFHSDIIKAILDPTSKHEEGTLFLKKFLEYLIIVAEQKKKHDIVKNLNYLKIDKNIRVVREEGRIDIKIEGENWAIIIENKINGASDMHRQIPRYIKSLQEQNKEIKTIVYLTASSEKVPDTTDWGEDEKAIVDNLLLPIVGFCETTEIKNLAEGWLEPCQLLAKGFTTKAVLSQYEELLKHQAGETMNKNELNQIIQTLKEHEINYSELLKVIQQIPYTYANQIIDYFSSRDIEIVSSAWMWRDYVSVLELKTIYDNLREVNLQPAIDINFEENFIAFFFRPSKKVVVGIEKYEKLLQQCDADFILAKDNIKISFNRDEVLLDQDGFVKRIEKILSNLQDRYKALETIANSEIDEIGK